MQISSDTIRIRAFRESDCDALVQIYRAAVCELGPRDYSSDQVSAWARLAPDAAQFSAAYGDGRIALVAVVGDDMPIAFSDVERNGHIQYLYRHPDCPPNVVALLYHALEVEARACGLKRLFVEASEAAKRFFEKHDFVVLNRRDFSIGGVEIYNYAMQKMLV